MRKVCNAERARAHLSAAARRIRERCRCMFLSKLCGGGGEVFLGRGLLLYDSAFARRPSSEIFLKAPNATEGQKPSAEMFQQAPDAVEGKKLLAEDPLVPPLPPPM